MLNKHPRYQELLNDIKTAIVNDQIYFLMKNRKGIIKTWIDSYTAFLQSTDEIPTQEDISNLEVDVNGIINDVFGPEYP